MPSFVAKMNAAAQSLRMSNTHYVDGQNGINPFSASTASDLLKLTTKAMEDPTFEAVVNQPTVNLPVAGTIWNYVPQVGTDGIVGVKSGFTQAANGMSGVGSPSSGSGSYKVLVLAAVTGQPGYHPTEDAATVGIPLLDSTATKLHFVQVFVAGENVARVTTDWPSSGTSGVVERPVTMMVWPGERLSVSTTARASRAHDQQGRHTRDHNRDLWR